jgi:hypothetical protein
MEKKNKEKVDKYLLKKSIDKKKKVIKDNKIIKK